MFQELKDFISYIEAEGDVLHLDEELSPVYEVAAAIRYGARKAGATSRRKQKYV